MHKVFIRILSSFILNRQKRKAFRKRLFEEHESNLLKKKLKKELKKYKNYKVAEDFFSDSIKPNSVLILEFNDFHGITLPGYIYYFQKLGYHTDCLLRLGQNIYWSPLCRLDEEYKAYIGNEEELIQILNSEKIKEYDFVFINTTFYYGKLGHGLCIYDIIGKVPSGKYGTLMIEHNYEPYVKQFQEQQYIKNGTLFTLMGFRDTKMLSSSFLGKVNIFPKNEKTVFLSVGGMSPSSRNFSILLDNCQKLIKNKITNFEVNIIGFGEMKIPDYLKEHIHFLGKLDYPSMYSQVEKSDFILTLFDPDNKEHHKYLDNWATGSSILFYAFEKLPLIHKLFAPSYFLTEQNAVIYDDFYEAMTESIFMSPKEYEKRQSALKQLTHTLQEQSFQNLKKQIERMKNDSK